MIHLLENYVNKHHLSGSFVLAGILMLVVSVMIILVAFLLLLFIKFVAHYGFLIPILTLVAIFWIIFSFIFYALMKMD